MLSEAGLDALEMGMDFPEAKKYQVELRGLFECCRSVEEEYRRLEESAESQPAMVRAQRHLGSLRDRTNAAVFVRPRVLRTARALGRVVLGRTDLADSFDPYRAKIKEIDADLVRIQSLRTRVLDACSGDKPINAAWTTWREGLADGNRYRRDDGRGFAVTVRNLSKRVGVTSILQGISLDVRPGEFVGILGASGAGKSTLLGALNGSRPALVGEVLYNGTDFYRHFRCFRHHIGYVPQDDIVHRDLTVHRALLYGAMLRGVGDGQLDAMRQRVDEVARIVELEDRQRIRVRNLSGGQRKRVSIAMELLADPPLMFLDEPTSGLDPALEEKMMAFFREQARQGRTVILTTHVMESVGTLDLVAMLKQGHLVYFGPPAEAPPFFGVQEFKDIYRRLDSLDAAECHTRLQASTFYRQRMGSQEPIVMNSAPPAGLSPEPVALEAPTTTDLQSSRATLSNARPVAPVTPARRMSDSARSAAPRQFQILARRHLDMIKSDTRTTAILLLQAPLIAFLLMVTKPTPPTLLFVLVLAALWFGCSNSVREIVKERAIYQRERMVMLLIPPYVGSKLKNLATLSLVQCAVLGLLAPAGRWSDLGGGGTFPLLFLTLLLTALGGVALGLLLSSLTQSSDKALSLVPMVILPQILFAGVLVPPENLGTFGRFLSQFCSLKWSYGFLRNFHLLDTWDGLFGMAGMNLLFVVCFLGLACYLLKRRDPL